jgi:hypothetical protein
MPVSLIEGSESPAQVVQSQAGCDIGIFDYIGKIVITDKTEIHDRCIHGSDCQDKQQTDAERAAGILCGKDWAGQDFTRELPEQDVDREWGFPGLFGYSAPITAE